MGNTPFYDKIAAVAGRGPRFFVPGHKGNPAALSRLQALAHWDLTEVEGACDLSHPTEELAASQANMARVFGAGASLYSASGSTSCVLAMLALFCGAGGAVVMARGAHVSAARALALLDITPHWVPLRDGRPNALDIDAQLEKSGAKAVYITTVDYYGRIPDVAGIAAVCQKHGAALLCDNAHGAHLRFFAGKGGHDRHPLALGAAAVADSAHKTLPCLTPAALLHLADSTRADEAREALNLFCSTSPSYPVLLSLDLAAGQLLDGAPDFAATAEKLKHAALPLAGICAPCDDPLRLVLCPARDAESFHSALLAEGIAPEYFDGQAVVLMASPWNADTDFALLHAACGKLASAGYAESPADFAPQGDAVLAALPETVCGVRAALFGPRRRLPVAESAGAVCAGLAAPCPPGVPPVLPGERITQKAAHTLAAGGILWMDVLK